MSQDLHCAMQNESARSADPREPSTQRQSKLFAPRRTCARQQERARKKRSSMQTKGKSYHGAHALEHATLILYLRKSAAAASTLAMNQTFCALSVLLFQESMKEFCT